MQIILQNSILSVPELEALDLLEQAELGRLPGSFKLSIELVRQEACGAVIWKNILGGAVTGESQGQVVRTCSIFTTFWNQKTWVGIWTQLFKSCEISDKSPNFSGPWISHGEMNLNDSPCSILFFHVKMLLRVGGRS